MRKQVVRGHRGVGVMGGTGLVQVTKVRMGGTNQNVGSSGQARHAGLDGLGLRVVGLVVLVGQVVGRVAVVVVVVVVGLVVAGGHVLHMHGGPGLVARLGLVGGLRLVGGFRVVGGLGVVGGCAIFRGHPENVLQGASIFGWQVVGAGVMDDGGVDRGVDWLFVGRGGRDTYLLVHGCGRGMVFRLGGVVFGFWRGVVLWLGGVEGQHVPVLLHVVAVHGQAEDHLHAEGVAFQRLRVMRVDMMGSHSWFMIGLLLYRGMVFGFRVVHRGHRGHIFSIMKAKNVL